MPKVGFWRGESISYASNWLVDNIKVELIADP